MNKVAFLFPGQGSQSVGMGQILAREEPAARDLYAEADEILGFPLSTLCFEGPADSLTDTINAQPAILAHSVAVLRVVEERLGPVGMAAGHSLGEFSAYVAAGTMSYRDALEAVRLRGELMYETGQARPGPCRPVGRAGPPTRSSTPDRYAGRAAGARRGWSSPARRRLH